MRTPQPGAPARPIPPGDSGQAIVEAAIILPAMIVLVLCIVQLTMVQHARIMTDYAAYCAARAGIVYNADRAAMERAATIALLPTMGRADDISRVTTTALQAVTIERGVRAAFGLPIVQINVVHPTRAEAQGANVSRHLNGQEIDFDDVRPAAARVNQLQLQVRYFYKMSVPFANWMLQNLWFAQRGNVLRFYGGMNMAAPTVAGTGERVAAAPLAAAGVGSAPLGWGLVAAGLAGRYYFPVEAFYSMRMQSNLFLNNLP